MVSLAFRYFGVFAMKDSRGRAHGLVWSVRQCTHLGVEKAVMLGREWNHRVSDCRGYGVHTELIH